MRPDFKKFSGGQNELNGPGGLGPTKLKDNKGLERGGPAWEQEVGERVYDMAMGSGVAQNAKINEMEEARK